MFGIYYMSKSVKSYASATSRRDKSGKEIQKVQIKQKIKEILYSVKEERQHIENRLHQKELQIQKLKQEYQRLKYDNDFDNLSAQEELIIGELAQGLLQMQIEPTSIIGKCAASQPNDDLKLKKLSKQQIIKVQEVLLSRLQNQLLEK